MVNYFKIVITLKAAKRSEAEAARGSEGRLSPPKVRKLELFRFKIHESELMFIITLFKKAWKSFSIFLELIYHLIDSIQK